MGLKGPRRLSLEWTDAGQLCTEAETDKANFKDNLNKSENSLKGLSENSALILVTQGRSIEKYTRSENNVNYLCISFPAEH